MVVLWVDLTAVADIWVVALMVAGTDKAGVRYF
jgi:hypothetical protein